MANPIKTWADSKLGKGKKPPLPPLNQHPNPSPPEGAPPMMAKAPNPLPPGGPRAVASPPMAPPPHPAMPPPHPAANQPGVIPGGPPGPAKPPDIRVSQLAWLGPEQQAELTSKEPDPPPSWVDPMKWEQAVVQIGQAWGELQEPRAVAAFIIHQLEQAAKAAAMPPPAPSPAAPPHPGAPPPHPGPPRPF